MTNFIVSFTKNVIVFAWLLCAVGYGLALAFGGPEAGAPENFRVYATVAMLLVTISFGATLVFYSINAHLAEINRNLALLVKNEASSNGTGPASPQESDQPWLNG